MAHVTDLTADLAAEAPAGSRRYWAARISNALIPIVEIPAALLVVAEIVVLLAGIIGRYVFHRPPSGRTSSPASCSSGSPCWAR